MSDKACVKIKPGHFCWNELMTPNPEMAKEFYKNLLGWEFEAHNASPEMTYTMIKNGEDTVGGLMQTPQGQKQPIAPHWGSYIAVDDLEATLEKAKSLGGTLVVDITPCGNLGRFAVIQDPTGAPISLWHSAPPSE